MTTITNGESGSSVRTKLNMALAVTDSQLGGTSFPGSPALNDRYYRTDRNIQYYYDGTRWLSTHLFDQSFGTFSGIAATTSLYLTVPALGTYGVWLVSWQISAARTAAGEWDIALARRNASNVGATIDTRDGSADADTVIITETRPLGSVLDATARQLQVGLTEISGASVLTGSVSLQYRLIG
jgi:hypothetical protein